MKTKHWLMLGAGAAVGAALMLWLLNDRKKRGFEAAQKSTTNAIG